MKVVPMIFNTQMVKAILAGNKTVTRRPAKNLSFSEKVGFVVGEWSYGLGFDLRETMNNCIKSKSAKCPAQIGDLIYVRETWREFSNTDECGCSDHCLCPPNGTPLYFSTHDDGESKWKPSIHMPRTASRLTLKVTDVRIERVHGITEDQAKNEGVNKTVWFAPYKSTEDEWINLGGKLNAEYRNAFATVWDSIYQNWNQNPYVWVIEFEVIHQNVDEYLESIKDSA
ncbi:hypothetical protein CRN61_17690 [Vibrio vulnificus]|uniref:hypothetical protein n=1 Tax=Vibrio vulnificus TaxID=672 RepID=UPI000C9E10A2|nr:hypothetical protein [Vibrio vulnificus]PNG65025.1 hypothetical protein SC81_07870 [Vibrio vulnificus]POC08159.1 hypothetical protein CRN54_16710 [Vibrio vulnificus]POC78024.1 hypothetical protein CRN61_17690 [Vibrio vulnificus]